MRIVNQLGVSQAETVIVSSQCQFVNDTEENKNLFIGDRSRVDKISLYISDRILQPRNKKKKANKNFPTSICSRWQQLVSCFNRNQLSMRYQLKFSFFFSLEKNSTTTMMLARGEEGGDKFSNSFSRLIDIARERDANQQHFHVYQFVRVFRQFSQE